MRQRSLAEQQWCVSMLGARQHYAISRALHQRGLLRLHYADLWIRRGRALLGKGPSFARRMAQRHHPELPDDKVVSFDLGGLVHQLRLQYYRRRSQVELSDFRADTHRRFARRVTRHLLQHGLHHEEGVFVGFTAGALESLELLTASPMLTVINQVEPGRITHEIAAREHRRWPGWQIDVPRYGERLWARMHSEWRVADIVLVNSDWSRKSLIGEGVPEQKITVVPLGYEPSHRGAPKPARRRQLPLRVLWLARVSLLKGIPYFLEAISALDPQRFEVTIVGSIGITDQGLRAAPRHARFVGHVSRAETVRYYRAADVYVLPTLSDGFATTQLEAMSHGVPVIATSACGEVVTDGVDGLKVPSGDSAALRAALERLERNRDEVAAMSRAALAKVDQFTMARYAEKLVSGVQAARDRL